MECSDEDLSCDIRTKPLATERCQLETCPQWTTGAWEKVKRFFMVEITKFYLICWSFNSYLDNICLLQKRRLFEYAVFSSVREVNMNLCHIRPHVQITCREQVLLLSPPVTSTVMALKWALCVTYLRKEHAYQRMIQTLSPNFFFKFFSVRVAVTQGSKRG